VACGVADCEFDEEFETEGWVMQGGGEEDVFCRDNTRGVQTLRVSYYVGLLT
jgi:hypothetical protein